MRHGHPELFQWSNLVRALSREHEIRTAWWVLPSKPSTQPELGAGVLSTADFESFNPDLILFDGPPGPRTPTERAQRGATVFLRAVPDQNDQGENVAFAEYGFPLATSKFGKPAWVQDQSGRAVAIDRVRQPPPLSLVRQEPLAKRYTGSGNMRQNG